MWGFGGGGVAGAVEMMMMMMRGGAGEATRHGFDVDAAVGSGWRNAAPTVMMSSLHGFPSYRVVA